jgi:hypothetical protein
MNYHPLSGVNTVRHPESPRRISIAANIDGLVDQTLEEISRLQRTTRRAERLGYVGYVVELTGDALASLALAITTFFFLAMPSRIDKIFVALIGVIVTFTFLGTGRVLVRSFRQVGATR